MPILYFFKTEIITFCGIIKFQSYRKLQKSCGSYRCITEQNINRQSVTTISENGVKVNSLLIN